MKSFQACALILVFGLFLSACSTGSNRQTPMGENETLAVIGFTESRTGNLTIESTRQANGLNLWIQQVNAAGGIRLNDGRLVKFESKSYDDESLKTRVQQLYTRLAIKDNATFLISPYSSGLADAAAVVAEQYNKIMITTGAASDSTYQRGFSMVFQVYTPASRYLTGAVDLLKESDPSARKLAIIHENDKFSTDVARAVHTYAIDQGYQVVFDEGYDTGTSDFAPFINKIESASPDVILGGGHFQDGTTFAKQLYEKQVPVKMVVLLVAPPEDNFVEIGGAARGIIGPSQWEPQVNFTPKDGLADLSFYGPSSADFSEVYQSAYNETPTYHAAGGYTAGLILQKAIESTGSLDTQTIKSAIESMDMLTFFGRIRFDTSANSHGLQVGHSMVYIQWQAVPSSALEKQVVWPAEGATAGLVYPLR
jgi:ABC-type branched-subunit amino acid transport system substrate-binding protein